MTRDIASGMALLIASLTLAIFCALTGLPVLASVNVGTSLLVTLSIGILIGRQS